MADTTTATTTAFDDEDEIVFSSDDDHVNHTESLTSGPLNDTMDYNDDAGELEDDTIRDDDDEDGDDDDDDAALPQPPSMMMTMMGLLATKPLETATTSPNAIRTSMDGSLENLSAVSSLSAGDNRSGHSLSSHHIPDIASPRVNSSSPTNNTKSPRLSVPPSGILDAPENTRHHSDADGVLAPQSPPPPFLLGAPQILEEDDSDRDLEEGQQPSQLFVKDWEDQDEQQPSRRKSSGTADLLIDATLAAGEARRGSGVRRSRRTSHAWGDLSHGHQKADPRQSVLLSELMSPPVGRSTSGVFRTSSSSGDQFGMSNVLQSPFSMSHGQESSTSFAAASTVVAGNKIHNTNSQAAEKRRSSASWSQTPPQRTGPSKILQRMQEGILQQQNETNRTISDYHTASTRASSRTTGGGNKQSKLRNSSAQHGSQLNHAEAEKERAQIRILYIIGVIICILMVVAVAIVIVLLIRNNNNQNNSYSSLPLVPTTFPTLLPTALPKTGAPSESPTTSPPSVSPTILPTIPLDRDTLDTILLRDRLNCGIIAVSGMAYRNDNVAADSSIVGDGWEGMDVDWCRALAAAILNDPNKVNFLVVSQSSRFPTLQSGAIDVLAAGTTFTMERNVFEPTAQTGFSFSIPYLYNGMGFGGVAAYVECAEAQDLITVDVTRGKNCSELAICVVDSTTHQTVVQELMPEVRIISRSGFQEIYAAFADGLCQVIAGEQFQIAFSVVSEVLGDDTADILSNYTLGKDTYSKEPLALVTRNDDPKWSDFCSWMVQALIFAEEQGIDASTGEAMREATVFGADYAESFLRAVRAVGNYGEIYNRHLEPILPRQTVNQVHRDENTGLLYSLPFGDLTTVGTGAVGTLKEINERGFLRCGVSRRPIFAEFNTQTQEWEGLEIDLCKAISAAIFDGIFSTIEYVHQSSETLLDALDNEEIDVMTGLTAITLENDVQRADSKVGHSFAVPLLYDALTFGGIPPFVQCANNFNSQGDCQDLRICVVDGSIYLQQAIAFFPARFLVSKTSSEEIIQGIQSGECNVLAGGAVDVSLSAVRSSGYEGTYETDPSDLPLPSVPMSLVTRQTDPQWSAFCFWIVNALLYAHEEGITQFTSTQMPAVVDVFGRLNFRIFRDAVAAIGSWGEWWDRSANSALPRGGLNALNTNPLGPQLHSYPGFL